MEFTDAYEELLRSSTYREWRLGHESFYLAHFFAELDPQLRPLNWEIGFYYPDQDAIVTFTVNVGILLKPEAQVFREHETVEKLSLSDIQLSSTDALYKARELQMKQYPQHPPARGIIILQHIPLGVVWNVTFITQSFAALNIKVDAENGEITHHNLMTFFDMRAK